MIEPGYKDEKQYASQPAPSVNPCCNVAPYSRAIQPINDGAWKNFDVIPRFFRPRAATVALPEAHDVIVRMTQILWTEALILGYAIAPAVLLS